MDAGSEFLFRLFSEERDVECGARWEALTPWPPRPQGEGEKLRVAELETLIECLPKTLSGRGINCASISSRQGRGMRANSGRLLQTTGHPPQFLKLLAYILGLGRSYDSSGGNGVCPGLPDSGCVQIIDQPGNVCCQITLSLMVVSSSK